MTQTIEKTGVNTFTISYGVRPNGVGNVVDDELKKEIQVVRKIDLALLNPEGVELPAGIINRLFDSIIIECQSLDRKAADSASENYAEKYAFLQKGYEPEVHKPGLEKERKAGKVKALENQVKELNSVRDELTFIIKNAEKLPIDASRKYVALMDDRDKQHEHYLSMLTHLRKSK